MNPLLKINDLHISFSLNSKAVKAVDGISFEIPYKKIVALVGESGSGKSVTALTIMGLIGYEGGKVEKGEIIFCDKNILKFNEKELCKIRGKEISMINQEPMASFNPAIPIGEQIKESLSIHKVYKSKERKKIVLELMNKVGIPDSHLRYKDYPSNFSGGMLQRLMIAMAISCNPKLLIADEPTTALDVSLQKQIMDMLSKMKNNNDMSILLITHDLGLVAQYTDYVIVMYCGKIMEESPVEILFKQPLHPYTIGLLNCIPRIDKTQKQLFFIPGYVPNISEYPSGCRFHNRCPESMSICRQKMPDLIDIDGIRKVRCWLYH